MNFSEALNLMKAGKSLTREAWDDKYQIATFEDNRLYKVVPCQVANYKHVKLSWCPTTTDILSNDWKQEN